MPYDCTGEEMVWENTKKEDNWVLAPETLLTSEETASAQPAHTL